MEDLELVAFKIISNVGSAKANYLEALAKAKEKEFAQAEALLKEGEAMYLLGHKAHSTLITDEAAGRPVAINLILMHAEDQLMNAETVRILVEELIEVYRKL